MKINKITDFNNKGFTAVYDAESRKFLREVKDAFDKIPEPLQKDVFVINENNDVGLFKMVRGKKVCISKCFDKSMTLQVANPETEVVDVFYHNFFDSSSDRIMQYKDKNIFPWFSGADEKIYSKSIKNMTPPELETIKNLLYKYIPEIFTGIKQLPPRRSLKKI